MNADARTRSSYERDGDVRLLFKRSLSRHVLVELSTRYCKYGKCSNRGKIDSFRIDGREKCREYILAFGRLIKVTRHSSNIKRVG